MLKRMYVQNMYILHVCIAINDGCEFKYIHGHRWISTNVDECQQMKFIHDYQTPLFVPILH
jgi:hypothetical protein